jgi:hypothetical protein
VLRDIGLPDRIKLSLSLIYQILFSFLINSISFMILLFAVSDKSSKNRDKIIESCERKVVVAKHKHYYICY